ncbi:uncharacterized protein EV422DRAFT_537018, partial [Fimicolochytrium jonesii]|uniref:uncharacterized protein n=1 Tax=Fimicolochytrium jonesii TaxID=1396493 RepID=UPI0022FDC1D4
MTRIWPMLIVCGGVVTILLLVVVVVGGGVVVDVVFWVDVVDVDADVDVDDVEVSPEGSERVGNGAGKGLKDDEGRGGMGVGKKMIGGRVVIFWVLFPGYLSGGTFT